MNIILMGPPGAGKGLKLKDLLKKYGLTQISTGDLFRKALREQTKFGVIAKYFMQFGHLVPDDYTIEMLREYLSENTFENGFILDGFPRTIVQARELESIAKEFDFTIDAIINLDIPVEKLITRLSGRRTCKIVEQHSMLNLIHLKLKVFVTNVVELCIKEKMRAKKLSKLDLIRITNKLDL